MGALHGEYCDERGTQCDCKTQGYFSFERRIFMTSTTRVLCRLLLLIGVLSFGTMSPGHAQAPLGEREGTATLEGWPRSLPTLLDEMGRNAPYLLPRIDSLALDYRYAATDTTSRWSFVLIWRPAQRLLYEGEVLPWRERPSGIHMTNVELRADVRVDGTKRTEMIIGVDSMALRPTPNRFAFNVTVSHDRVFLDTPPAEARRILSEGATLDRLVVERMGFSSESPQQGGRSPDARQRQEEPPRAPSIYTPRTRIYLGWRVGPRPYYVGDRPSGEGRETRPRDATMGRTSTADADRSGGVGRDDAREEGRRSEEGTQDGEGRSEGSGDGEGDDRSRLGKMLSGDDDEDDDEDDTDLRTPALAAAAAVGILAFAGGTAGLYGRGETPIGLASGYTHPKGGIQFQAAVNSAVLENDPNQKLSAKALGFYDVFESRVQPAVGLGIQVGSGNGRDIDPAVSGGLVGNFGRFVLYGGVDVVEGTPEVGVTYNFRSSAGEDDEN